MRSPITKIAAAAAIIIAVLIAINQFGGSIDLANKAFAEVALKVKMAKTVSWTSKSLAEVGIYPEGNDYAKFKIIEPYLARVEFPDGKIWILDYSARKGLILDPDKKTAEVLSLLPNTLSVYDDYKNLLNFLFVLCLIRNLQKSLVQNVENWLVDQNQNPLRKNPLRKTKNLFQASRSSV